MNKYTSEGLGTYSWKISFLKTRTRNRWRLMAKVYILIYCIIRWCEQQLTKLWNWAKRGHGDLLGRRINVSLSLVPTLPLPRILQFDKPKLFALHNKNDDWKMKRLNYEGVWDDLILASTPFRYSPFRWNYCTIRVGNWLELKKIPKFKWYCWAPSSNRINQWFKIGTSAKSYFLRSSNHP